MLIIANIEAFLPPNSTNVVLIFWNFTEERVFEILKIVEELF